MALHQKVGVASGPLAAPASFPLAQTREAVGAAVEVLIGLLDVLDGDADVEPNGDEADYSIAGWLPGRYGTQLEDAEDDDPPEPDDHGEDGDGI